ncbi:FAD/NAD(P)-binding protein [Curtobacterium sp. ZW137]|uniref:FAD/NAD(P)-binding protein n=1 Tax=Curtobacterium sp. ZW137 TaxID=2485104 RepID=UPI000FAD1F81|nr:FAD/NAD(P)-binding protein [Curtobacterium sp. ZW137]ROP65878.1 putative NAD(P)/FAD-binding protein YdhS [Curtobacterium sp. ZW137]
MTGTSIVIVGGGASAVYVAVALEERSLARGAESPTITVVAAEPTIGRGVAYGRADEHHRLNSPAGKMSVSAEDDTHFLRWAAEHGRELAPGDFIERRFFGDYLEDVWARLVARSDGRVRAVQGDAVDLRVDDAGASVTLTDGTTIDADVAVLAIGNPPPATWQTGAAVQIDDPWEPGAIAGITAGASVLLIGTGLTMVDVATSLARRDDGIRLTATSRHLLVPAVHLDSPAAPGPGLSPDARSLGSLASDLRAQLVAADADGAPWQPVIDGIRPRLMDHWLGLSEPERRRFLSHFARRWDVHRHRMAPSVHAELTALVDAGTLRYERDADPAAYDVVVFCTGPAAVTTPGWSPVVDALLAAGRIVPEPVGLGPDADASGALRDVHGVADGRLLGIGHALRGALWETTAIGEVRILAQRVADRALDVERATVA